MDWLDQMLTTLAERTGTDPSSLTLDQETRRAILDVARIASHTSGNRINAPLLCYVLGLLAQRGAPLGTTVPLVEEIAGPA